MEQRTRILHHTRSKKPIILASTCSKPPIVSSTSLSSLSTGRQDKAPLASLDTELSSRRRRRRNPHHGGRSKSAGRHEEGSKRIVSREVFDLISDWSNDDDDTDSVASSSLGTPLRRHTMGSSTRPWRTSQESSDCQPTTTGPSRKSSPPEVGDYLDTKEFFQRGQDQDWTRFSQTLPNRPTRPMESQRSNLEVNPNSKRVDKEKEHPSNVSSRPRALPVTAQSSNSNVNSKPSIKQMCDSVPSPTTPTNSNSYQPRVPYLSSNQARPNSCHQFQKDPVPSPASSRALGRSSVNLPPTITSPQHSVSASSHRQPSHQPPSSLNIRPTTLASSPAVTSPTTYVTRHKTPSPQANTNANTNTPPNPAVYSWKTDPRRRPIPADGQFVISPGKESRSLVSPTNPTSRAPTQTASPNTYSSTALGRPSGGHLGNNTFSDKARESNTSQGRLHPSQQYNPSSINHSTERGGHKGYTHNGPSSGFTQGNDDRNVPRQDHGATKTYPNCVNSTYQNHKSVSTGAQGCHQIPNNYFSQISNTMPRPNNNFGHPSNPLVNSFVPEPFRYARKRESMRMATEGYLDLEFPDLSLPSEGGNLRDSKQRSGYSDRPDLLRASAQHNEIPRGQRDSRHFSPPPPDTRNKDGYTKGQVNHHGSNSQTDFNNKGPSQALPESFVRGSFKRDSYRLATSSNPDLTSIDQVDDIFVSCEDILDSSQSTMTRNTPISFKDFSAETLRSGESDITLASSRQSNENGSPYNASSLAPSSNTGMISRIKRNSLRLATASLSDLSVILDEIDISEPSEPSPSITNSIGHPSPVFNNYGPKLSPLIERSLGRSGSSVSSKNSSSFGSFYSCQSIAHSSAKSSPLHVSSSNSSPRITKPPQVSTPDSVHKLIMANAHDSGISQSSEDTNSFSNLGNTSIGSGEDADYSMNHFPLAGSLNRKRPMYYWTRQAPYPRQMHNTNTIPASWKPNEVKNPSRSPAGRSPRYSKPGSNIRSYGSSSSVESGSSKTKPTRQPPASTHLLQRYGCGLDGRGIIICGKGSAESLSHHAKQAKPQTQYVNGVSTGNRENTSMPINPNNRYRPGSSCDIDYHHYNYTQPPGPDSPPILESPDADTPRSPPSLGRPRRKMYAGFDSQPLPMDTFLSDSSSVYTAASNSSRRTDMSGQPDSGTFDESFYSIDNRSLVDEKGFVLEASLTPNDFMNLSDIHHNTQLRHQCRSNSMHSTSTAKEGDVEDSDNDDVDNNVDDVNRLGKAMTQYQHHHPHHHHAAWNGANYNHGLTSSLPMTFSI